MTRRRMSKDEYEAMVRAAAQKIKPGTIKGRMLDSLPVEEEMYFYTCKQCGKAVDMRELGQVFHHEVLGHQRLPEN
jgi:hypothetical protein